MATVKLDGVRKVYAGGVEAVKGVSIDIADGQLCVLVGPSGCGKSTLLRMIAGLEVITDGEISIDDRVVNRLEPAERDIAMVFQNYALYPHMSVRGNLEYGLKNRATPRPEIDARVAEAARMLEITPFLDRKPGALSGGQRQRVAMGRAVVRKPQAFLFDEPLSNLDAKLRTEVRVEIRNLQQTLGITTIMVTHDQEEALTMADRLVVMNEGRIQQIGNQKQLYDTPANAFVASFVGRSTFLKGRFRDNSLVTDGGLEIATSKQLHGPAMMALRPERVAVSRTPVEGAANCFEGKVEFVSFLGGMTDLHVHLRGEDSVVAQVVNREGEADFEIGDRVYVSWPPVDTVFAGDNAA